MEKAFSWTWIILHQGNIYSHFLIEMHDNCDDVLTLYVAVTQFTYGKLRHCYVKS